MSCTGTGACFLDDLRKISATVFHLVVVEECPWFKRGVSPTFQDSSYSFTEGFHM